MEFLQIPVFDDDLYKLLVRFAINFVVVLTIVFVCYRPKRSEGSFTFSFMLLNIMVFFTCFTMKKLELELGMALGLFAIFGIMRYRTDTIPIREMTYLFVVVGVAVINALSNKKTSYAELATTDVVIIAAALLLEYLAFARTPGRLNLVYDRLDLLHPGQRHALHNDIAARCGLQVVDVRVSKIDLLKGTAAVAVSYETSRRRGKSDESNSHG